MNLSGRKMLWSLVLMFTTVALTVTLAPTTPLSAASSNPRAYVGARQAEVRRIHVHFDSVLRALSAANVSQLTQQQRFNRMALMKTLQGYNARGEFPHNYDFTQPTPYFIDRKTGTLCAVAFLLESTGRRTMVDRVARTDNNVWVANLRGDTAFAQWLDAQGISLDEAARIQVPYQGSASPDNGVSKAGVALFVAGVYVPLGTTIGVSAWNALGNSDGHSRAGAYVGLVTSVATSAVGLSVRSSQANATGSRVAANSVAGVGVVGAVLAARSLMHRPRYLAMRAESGNTKRGTVQTSVSPIIPLSKDGGTGLSMSIRF